MKTLLNISILAILLATGCNKAVSGDFWVSGLSLPPGSTVANRTEEFHTIDDPDSDDASMNSLMINFDSSANWDEVVAYFDKNLGSLGYTDISFSTIDMNSPDMSETDRLILESGRIYENKKTRYLVSISTMQWMFPSAVSNGQTFDLPPFSMVVTKFNKR